MEWNALVFSVLTMPKMDRFTDLYPRSKSKDDMPCKEMMTMLDALLAMLMEGLG